MRAGPIQSPHHRPWAGPRRRSSALETSRRHSTEALSQRPRIKMELERLLPVDLHHGYALAVPVVKRRVERHVHLMELEVAVEAHGLDGLLGLVAQAAPRLAVERDRGHAARASASSERYSGYGRARPNRAAPAIIAALSVLSSGAGTHTGTPRP